MDPIADFLIRIKNGYSASKKEVAVPYSKLKEKLAKILVEEGYLQEIKSQKSKVKNMNELVLTLKYEGKKPALTDLRRISKPGLRVFAGKNKLPNVLSGLGISIISTTEGLMTDKQARKKSLGGEIVCKVW